MDILKRIEAAHFVATEDDIETLAHVTAQAQNAATGTYLKALVATTQHALTGHVTLRALKGRRAAPDAAADLAVFEKVNASLYAAVIRGTVTPDVADAPNLEPAEARRRSMERNRRNNYARTSAYAVRLFIRRGGDVRRLAVPTLTKGVLADLTPESDTETVPATEEERLAKRITANAARVKSLAEELGKLDRAAGVAALREALAVLSGGLAQARGSRTTTSSPEVAIREGRVLKTPSGAFWPVNLESAVQ